MTVLEHLDEVIDKAERLMSAIRREGCASLFADEIYVLECVTASARGAMKDHHRNPL